MEKAAIGIILNLGDALSEDIRQQVEILRERGHRVRVCVAWEKGEAQRQTRVALSDGFTSFVAAGGDGTIHEVAEALVLSEVSGDTTYDLAVLPCGTGNDFARTALPVQTRPADLARLYESGQYECVPIDVGRTDDDTILVNALSMGSAAEATDNCPPLAKGILGPAAYGIQAFIEWIRQREFDISVVTPEQTWEGRAKYVAVANGRYVGGGIQVAAKSELSDGLLTVMLIPAMGQGWLEDAEDLVALQQGLIRNAIVMESGSIEIRLQEEVPATLDGERFDRASWKIVALPDALRLRRLCAPEEA